MKLWDISGDGGFWKVQLDVRDLGGHLDFTYRARAGTLSRRVGGATVVLLRLVLCLWDLSLKLDLVRGKYLLTSGLMVAEKIFPLLGASRLLALVLISLLLKLPLIIRFGARLKSMVMLGLSVAVLFFLSLVFCRLCNVLNSGVLLLLCRLAGLVIWVLTTLM